MMAKVGTYGGAACTKRGHVGAVTAKRRQRAVEEQWRIVDETFAAGTSAARVARAHGVNANQVFLWRGQYRQGLLGPGNTGAVSLLPVRVSKAMGSKPTRTAKLHGVYAGTCLHNALSRIVRPLINHIDELLPWNLATNPFEQSLHAA
jgi:transposase-like protein